MQAKAQQRKTKPLLCFFTVFVFKKLKNIILEAVSPIFFSIASNLEFISSINPILDLNFFRRNLNYICAFVFGIKIICAAVKYIPVFRIKLYYHISVLTFWAFKNVVFVDFIICHEITDFCIICTNPEIKSVIFIKLIF